MLDTYNQQAHRHTAITILAGISSRNHYFICEERTNYKYIRKYMIAKIYPDGHPDLQGKKDPTHPVRYFDIRKLTPRECYSLMGVPQRQIETLMKTEKKPYLAWVGVDDALAVFGLDQSATRRDVDEAYREAIEGLNGQTSDDAEEQEGLDEDAARIMAQEEEDDAEERRLLKQNYDINYQNIWSRIVHSCGRIFTNPPYKRCYSVGYFSQVIAGYIAATRSATRPANCVIYHILSILPCLDNAIVTGSW